MAKKKYKRMTATEKRLRKECKQDLVARGVLPPPKKPLNRKKLCKEVHAAIGQSKLSTYRLREALPWMLPPPEPMRPITPEEVGVLKLVQLAIDLDRFWVEKAAEKKDSATYEEIYQEVVRPILEL